jgi:hypothetical protein
MSKSFALSNSSMKSVETLGNIENSISARASGSMSFSSYCEGSKVSPEGSPFDDDSAKMLEHAQL